MRDSDIRFILVEMGFIFPLSVRSGYLIHWTENIKLPTYFTGFIKG